ncbi:MAG: hypothetical protein IIX39_04725 [Clostridia bacterium]|nr:hypothetical protein [Clostridia bacterium]
MVNGDILKKIVKFAIPCIWVRIIQNIYPLMDSLVVGKILNLESISAAKNAIPMQCLSKKHIKLSLMPNGWMMHS